MDMNESELELCDLRRLWKADLQFREEIISRIVQSIGKTGSLEGSAEFALLAFPGLLDVDDILELEQILHSQSKRARTEWRPYFDRTFCSTAASLPQISLDEWAFFYAHQLFHIILTAPKQLETLRRVLDAMNSRGVAAQKLPLICEFSLALGILHPWPNPMYNNATPITWLDLAHRSNVAEVVQLLLEYGFTGDVEER